MTLARERPRRFHIRYRLGPWGQGPPASDAAEVALAMPRSEIRHDVKLTQWKGPEALEKRTDARGNEVWKLVLGRGQGLTAAWDVCAFEVAHQAGATSAAGPVTEEDLAGGPLCPVDDRMLSLAERLLAGGSREEEARARVLFQFVTRELSYVYPPRERGAAAALARREGDCGEFSWLFVSLSRAAGLPARPVLGLVVPDWAPVTPHAWAEVHLKDRGWIPVDCSMAQGAVTGAATYGVPAEPARYFGCLDNKRLVLSRGTGLPWPGAYGVVAHKHPGTRMRIDGADVYWGQELLQGAIPYLQPAYVRIEALPARLRADQLMGRFDDLRVHPQDRSPFWPWLRKVVLHSWPGPGRSKVVDRT